MELLKKINIEYSQYKKYLYKKLTTYTMISIKNKVKSNQVIKDNFVSKINELVEIENKTLKDKQTIRNYAFMCKKRMNLATNNGNTWSDKTVLFGH